MKRTIIYFLSMAIALGAFSGVHAYSIPSSAGETGLAFLKVGIGSRNLAMGDAGVASAYDATAVYYNPALLPKVASRGLFFTYHNFIQDINQQYIGGNFQWLGSNYFGFGVNLFTIPDIEKRTGPTTNPISEFDSRDLAFNFAWGRSITSRLSLGIGFKYLYEKIDVDELTGYAFDFGASYDVIPMLRIGASYANVGPEVEFISESFELPKIFRFGAALMPQKDIYSGRITVAAEVSKYTDSDMHGHIGLEYSYKNMISPRLGYALNFSDKGFTGGLGIRYSLYSIDYAYVPFDSDLGDSHRLSLGVWFK
ncbi:MAG: PorV/PorQ family protein [candidate division Zixibacteria bacterium]|nr:PorV/PorQ family protein [candidate division Zixibacteria bacterium]